MMRTRSVAALACWLALVPAPGHAVEPGTGQDPVLEALVAEALEHNPDVAAARAAMDAANARPLQARALPDPMLALGYNNDGWAFSLGEQQMSRLGLMWSQDLPWPGKRALRGRIAEAEALLVDQQLERVRLSLGAQVRRSYAELLLARQLLDLVREQEQVWQQIEGVARARYAVGQGAQQDVLRVQIEVTRIGQLRVEQEFEERVRLAELNRLLARPAEAPLETAARLELRAESRGVAALIAGSAETSPELRAAEAAIERERLAVALARKDFKPDFNVQAGYMNRGRLDPMWQAGASINLPLDRKRRESALAEAQARLRQAERRLDSMRLQLRLRTEERAAQLDSTEAIVRLYERGVVPQDQMSVEAAMANYQTGKIPFITVLEALSTLYSDRTTQLRLVATHAKTAASLAESSLEGGNEPMAGLPARTAAGVGAMMGAGGMLGGMASARPMER